ncbi:VOC family protein [Actinoplanes sp. NPDC051470]|uniref:bleomycin resistance protein n=1 Tax=unclassified Actinoplanes TaxID=2626549 RepID=UPI003413ED94
MATFTRIAPILPVRDLEVALDRYRRLGFEASAYAGPERYGYADRDGISLHLSEVTGHDPLTTSSMVYLYVSDADAVHAEWAAAGVGGRLSPPRDTAWGLREFSYVDPDGSLHRVGSPLERPGS